MNMAYVAIFLCFAGSFIIFVAVIANKNNEKSSKNKD